MPSPERPRAALIDFSGTLFHIESARDAVLAALGPELLDRTGDLRRLGAINGSGPPEDLPADLEPLWAVRDLSAEKHREAYTGSSRRAGLTPEQAERLYERGMSPEAWHAYDDTVPTLRRLRELGIPVAVVSNIGWDPRPIFEHFEVTGLLDVLVLSDERGVQKPDPEIFRIACRELGHDPADCVMVGDSAHADGGSEAVGIPFRLVSSDPARRTGGTLLRAVLGAIS